MADNPPTLGTILTGTHYRDAIHIAIAPVIAQERLFPGQRIGFVKDTDTTLVHRKLGKRAIGIVDPFLTDSVNPGDQFYMFLLPNTVTGLRHEWTHPSFPNHQNHILMRDGIGEVSLSDDNYSMSEDDYGCPC